MKIKVETVRKVLGELAPYAKAVGAFLIGLAGFLTVLVAALSDGTIDSSEVVTIIGAVGAWLGSTTVVYSTPNANGKG